MKKLFILSLSILLVLGTAACGDSDKAKTAALRISPEATDEATEEQTQAKIEEPIQTPEPEEPVIEMTEEEKEAEQAKKTVQSLANKDGYFNIAIFGLDVNTNLTKDDEGRWKQLMKGFRSDTIMIASINIETGDIKLVSVYRDTFLNTGTDNYHKANSAYSIGGPLQAVKMLNINLDMDIEKYIAISYHSMIDLVDGLGGITVDVEPAALKEIDGYQMTIVHDLELEGYTPVTESGPQALNGLQVCAYCRLRHDFPRGDLDRAAHQRKVLRAIEEKVKQTDILTLTSIFYKVIEELSTNFDAAELLALISGIDNYRIAGEGGFPADSMVTIGTLGKEGSCVIPMDLENNVIWLHQFLFDDEEYSPSQTMLEIDATIKERIAPYIKK